jgi:PAS domain S-box-containing protein
MIGASNGGRVFFPSKDMAPASERSTTVVLSVPDLETSMFWTMLQHAVRRHARRVDDMRLLELPAASLAAQITSLRNLDTRGTHALLLYPISTHSAELAEAVSALHRAGVRVVLLDAADAIESDGIVMPDVGHAQESLARLAFADLEPGSHVLRLEGEQSQESGRQKKEGWYRALASRRDLRVVPPPTVEEGNLRVPRERGFDAICQLHAEGRMSDIALIAAADDDLAMGAVDALCELNIATRVCGLGGIPEALSAVENGELSFTAATDYAAFAAAAWEMACSMAGSAHSVCIPVEPVTVDNARAFIETNACVMSSVMTDMARRVREDKLASRFLEAVVDNMPAMLFVKEAVGLRYFLVNKAREKWLGIGRRELIGKTAYDFNPKEIADRYTASDRAVLAAGTIVDQPEVPVVFPSGETRYVLTRKIPLFDANGRAEFLLGISLDVTAKKLAEQALAKRNEELEAAHAALKENQHKLLVSEKMAALGRLTAGIAHEMNTPLAAIRAAMSELQSLVAEYQASIGDDVVTSDDHAQIAGEMAHCVELARKSAERAAGFVRSVKHHTRDLSRQEKVAFSAVQVTRESVFLLDHALKSRRCKVEFDFPPGDIQLFGLAGSFSQVVTNLVNNAIDACADDGSGQIRIGLVQDEQQLRMTVSDNGSGIAPENMARIFDPMFTTKPFGQGTGLGLAIVHEILNAEFNGEIEVISHPGEGAHFTIRLPALREGMTTNGA